ncbi:ATP-binding protein [Asticcacaulis sp. EMRT-3]|uniref:ATP-binding protein n=1 Tax=Asticcacaulis sp. EMRT-3 TaxID=3040349 RepID=UPI0024AF569D|nr:ATP-binding protein [Asticcacaulis sp. EMRT-3]MDI7774618.1 ATP-binding protein [Asticcacaulis sp. EMRT-3]
MLFAQTSFADNDYPSPHHAKLVAIYNLISAKPFIYSQNEVDKFGQQALRLNGDARLYALWRVLYAYKNDHNDARFQAWHARIMAQAQKDSDANLDVLARLMYQTYQNESDGFTSLSEREWTAYMTMPDAALQNIAITERVRQLQHFQQWADAIDMGDKLIVRLNAAGSDAAPLLMVAHQVTAYSVISVGDNDSYANHMYAIAKLLDKNAFFSQKMDTVYDIAFWAAKENDLPIAEKFQQLHAYYVKKYDVTGLKTWDEFLCANVEDAAQKDQAVITCLSGSSVAAGQVSNFLDYSKLQLLTKAYAHLGDIAKTRFYLAKIRSAPDPINPHDKLFEQGIEAFLLKAEGHKGAAFNTLYEWSRIQFKRDEAVRADSVQSMYKALRKELDSKTAESRLLVRQVQMGHMLLAAAVLIALLLVVILLGGLLWAIRMRRMQMRLSDARAHAEAANAAKSRFLAVMSHELRTPLNGVLGMAQTLKKENLSAGQREQVEILLDSGQTLMVLLNDVLDMSRIEADHIELAPTPSNMKDMVDRVINTYSSLLVGKAVTLTSEFKANAIMPMSFDILRVYQCLSNLVSNAIKFTEKGSVRIVVSAERKPGGYFVRVEVHDSGIGMNAATLTKLFDAYSQADAMTSHTYGGTGLGLNISRRLAELMGGHLTVTSEEGAGSVFVMTFEAGDVVVADMPEDIVVPEPAETVPESASSLQILLVDDHPVNRKVARLFLEPFGFNVIEVVDGQEALDQDMSRFDLVLMDINMPRLNGLEATRIFRASEAPGRHVPIVALTADAMQDQIEACYAAGMDAHISKPILMDTLIDTVSRLLEARQKSEDAAARAV